MVVERAIRMAVAGCTECHTWLCKRPLVGRLGGGNRGLCGQSSNTIRSSTFQKMANGIYNSRDQVSASLRGGWCYEKGKYMLTTASAGGVTTSITLGSGSPHSTAVLAAYFASVSLSPGDCYLLYGNVGAGKSLFSRSFIQHAMEDEDIPVPSPTYLLQHTYQKQDDSPELYHFDLYRLKTSQDLARLSLGDCFRRGVCLVEWAERLDIGPVSCLPESYIEVHISMPPGRTGDMAEQEENDERFIRLVGRGDAWVEPIQLLQRHVNERGADIGLWTIS